MLSESDARSLVERLADRLYGRISDVRRNERYYRGEQPLTYASAEWRAFNERRFTDFSDNWCQVVGSSPAERIRLTGLRVGTDTEIESEDERRLMAVWHENELDAQSSQGFLHTIVAARSFVIVDPTGPTVSWERADQVLVDYDEASKRATSALKIWHDKETEYATVYTADEIWKFQRPFMQDATKGENIAYDDNFRSASDFRAGTAAPFTREGGWIRRADAVDWPATNPLGALPVVEIPNRPTLGGEPLSDIAGTIAMQDAINLLWAYLFAAADFASMPARVVMGQEPPKVPILDTSGNIIGEKPVEIEQLTKGRMLWLTGESSSIGQWEAAKLDTFTDVINRCVRHIASQTRTPIHYISGEVSNVNSETLIALETGLVKKCEEFQLFASGAMRSIFKLIALALGDTDLADRLTTAVILWADPATRTQAQASDAALKDRQVGFPLAWVAEKRYGLTQAEVSAMLSVLQTEADSALSGILGPMKPEPQMGDSGPDTETV